MSRPWLAWVRRIVSMAVIVISVYVAIFLVHGRLIPYDCQSIPCDPPPPQTDHRLGVRLLIIAAGIALAWLIRRIAVTRHPTAENSQRDHPS